MQETPDASENSSSSSQSDIEQDSIIDFFSLSSQMNLESTIYQIVSRLERHKLFEHFKNRARFEFIAAKNQILFSYNDEAVKGEIRKWISAYNFKQYKLNGESKIKAAECPWIKDEVQKHGFRIFMLNGQSYIVGHGKTEQQFSRIKAFISSFVYQLVPDKLLSENTFSKTEKFIFLSLFHAAMAGIEYSNKEVLSVDPIFIGKKSNILKYVLRSTEKPKISSLPEQVREAYRKYRSLVFMVAALKNIQDKFETKYVNAQCTLDKKIKQSYLCVVFKKKYSNQVISKSINEAVSFYGCKVEGIRFFRKFTKLKLKYLPEMLQNENSIFKFFPQNDEDPYSFVINFKHFSAVIENLNSYIEVAKSKTSEPKEDNLEKTHTLSNTQQVIISLEQEPSNDVENPSIISTINYQVSGTCQQEKESDFVFELKNKPNDIPYYINKIKSLQDYTEYKFKISKFFQKSWQENNSQIRKVIVQKFAWKNITGEMLNRKISKFVKFENIENLELLGAARPEYLIAQIKDKEGQTMRNSYVKPILLITRADV